jgi:hypothetical protein
MEISLSKSSPEAAQKTKPTREQKVECAPIIRRDIKVCESLPNAEWEKALMSSIAPYRKLLFNCESRKGEEGK